MTDGLDHRLHVACVVLGIVTEAPIECDADIVNFSRTHDVSLDWLILGEGGGIRSHLSRHAPGQVVILPVRGPLQRRT